MGTAVHPGRTTPPDDLVIRRVTRKPVHDEDLMKDLPVESIDSRGVANPLVVMGDSLAHGFKSLAIHDTNLSWPKLVANAMGLGDTFRFPLYDGPKDCPGLPLNLEAVIRNVETGFDGPLVGRHLPLVFARLLSMLRHVRHYWEQGAGSMPLDQTRYMHNLSIYGWDVLDATQTPAGSIPEPTLLDKLRPHLPKLLVSADQQRAARRVLVGPAGADTTATLAAQGLGKEGVGTLIVALGANNALGSVTKMKLVWTPPEYPDMCPEQRAASKGRYTVWAPKAFEKDYGELMDAVKTVGAHRVVLATVPHVTVAPLLHGFGDKVVGSRYFARYGRVWASEQSFDPNNDDCLSGTDCRQIDSAIDAFNETILDHVCASRRAGLDWHLLDLCALLDSLAYRRYFEDPTTQHDFPLYVLPPPLLEMSPMPDTRFFNSDAHGRSQGGLIALDGVHPTTIGYGIVAREVLKVLALAGVVAPGTDIDFASLLADDTLNCEPLRTWTADVKFVGWLVEHFDRFRSLIEH